MRDYSFGNLITKLREEHGYSQYQLGKLLRVSGKAVSKWETGSAKPRIATLSRLAAILDVSLDTLLSPGQIAVAGMKTMLDRNKRRKKTMSERQDTNKRKHIELHVRTGFSRTNGFGLPQQYLDLAEKWEQPAIAFTDYAGTRGFPEISRQVRSKSIKWIPGCEISMIPAFRNDPEDAYTVMILVKNREGMKHLNHILTDGFLHGKDHLPCIRMETLEKLREGLLIGCSCNGNGWIRQIAESNDELSLSRLQFFDYLEIEPVENTLPENYTETEIAAAQEERKEIVRIGQKYGIPVVAVGNVCYPEPENAFDYAVLRYNSGETETDFRGSHYLHTTSEMMKAFRFLGPEDCRHAVIDAPQTIAGQIDDSISLYPDDSGDPYRFHPASKEDYDSICGRARFRAAELYGSPLPPLIHDRLEKELEYLRNPHSAFQFELARKLVQRSREEGYPVGTRGSICSSLVAMLIGITDVNPLPAHYRCPICGESDFTVDPAVYACGADLPKKACSLCGSRMTGDGFRIPEQVLFGWDGTKEIDIDLNFSGEYRDKVYQQMMELFGRDRICCAGTVTGMAPEKAEKYIRCYLDDHEEFRDNKWIANRAETYWNVAVRSGCHTGGFMIAQEGYAVKDFTPLQYTEETCGEKAAFTHYDFNYMHGILLKMDCLGHNVPTLLHLLEENCGVRPEEVPLRNENVMPLFRGTESLGMAEHELLCRTGTYGIPEFNTPFVQRMLRQIQPETVEELIRISGWSHGTGVWLGNAQERIAEDPSVRFEYPATRDDILHWLSDHGMDEKDAYLIMERVRKGKGLTSWQETLMKSCGISNAYIEGCRKIQYLFPKAHAAAYVENSMRIAWYKVYRPKAFYSSWFQLLEDSLGKEDRSLSPDELRKEILELRNSDTLRRLEKTDRIQALELILEAKLRGFDPAEL